MRKERARTKGEAGDSDPANNCRARGGVAIGQLRCNFYKVDFQKDDNAPGGVDPKFRCLKPELADEPRGGNCNSSTVNPPR